MIRGLVKLRGLDPRFARVVQWCLEKADEEGLDPVLDYGIRTHAEQAVLYQRYLRGGPKAAPPGLSLHQYGLAVDVYAGSVVRNKFRYDANQDKIRAIFLGAGLEGVSGDPPHFQYPGAQRLLPRRTQRPRGRRR